MAFAGPQCRSSQSALNAVQGRPTEGVPRELEECQAAGVSGAGGGLTW